MMRLLLLPLAVGLSYAATAQEVLAVGGGSDHTEQLALDWTVGQLATHTLATPGGLFTQGFHQPLLHVLPPAPATTADANVPTITVFPNPTQSLLNVTVTGAQQEAYSILEVLDTRGRMVVRQQSETYRATRQLDLIQLPPGTYQLRVAQASGQHTQTFTVIKLN
ncbi:hypothetical protein LEM8419_00623 [Neolewinella maritima]|uniref:Secretion system C-terminal sorting domain-containing protein n=1 Tax=Neolewinella maritima TaxID=1383882 RepID=A0ABM9AX71_9BACT|nr:T9SS type A sorting domain-containing protein [Neolewinella maritima]CAH0999325.1 hypothetical protein LEM8419_00623 [Neolewinella maritima]